MKKIHPEFAYQSRELGFQIEDTLGDPPNPKNYQTVVKTLLAEYAKGNGLEDINFLSFALIDHLIFNDPAGLLVESASYESGDYAKVMKMISSTNETANQAMAVVLESNPELLRKAIVTAFLYKNQKRWTDEDTSLDALQQEEDSENEEEEDDHLTPGHDIEHLFDSQGDDNV